MLLRDEQAAVDELELVRCDDEWCDGKCHLCAHDHVLLGDALAAIEGVRAKRRESRNFRLDALLDDEE
jgi:hypothetical protein